MKALLYWMVALMVTMGACTSDVDKDKDDDEEIAEWDELAVTLEVTRPTTAKFWFTSEASDKYEPENFVFPTPKVDFPTELEINWGDGQTSNSDSHEYQSAGTYLVKIKGKGIGTLENWSSSYTHIKQFTVKSWPSLVHLTTLPVNIDFTQCPKLESVNCYISGDNIKSDFSKCPRLKYLFLGGNITDLNVTGCTGLKIMECQNCKLSKLDISSCTQLEILDCSRNQITQLDVSPCAALTKLFCSQNKLTTLDVSKNAKLTILNLGSNKLTNLDVSKNTKLASLKIEGNQLANLDVSKNTKLATLLCNYNKIKTLNLSKCPELRELTCSKNQITDIDISGCPMLYFITCSSNQLNHPALNNIYNTLSNVGGIIYIGNNPSTGDTYIATQKGWEVVLQDF